jgi:hypothetical protein
MQSLVIKEGSALPRQSPTLPRGLKGGNPLRVEIFLEKRSFLPECLSCFSTTSKVDPENDGVHVSSHVVILIIIFIIIVVARRFRRRLPRESLPLLPTTELFQGVSSPRPLAGSGLLRVLLFLLLLRGNPPRCSVHRVLRDPWPGRLVPPYLLGTDGNPDRKDQGQPDARRRKERTLTRVTHPWSGHIKG